MSPAKRGSQRLRAAPSAEGGPGLDLKVFLLAGSLALWGLVMMYSASAIWAYQNLNDTAYFLKKQTLWLILGFSGLAAATRIHHERLREWAWPVMIIIWLLLIAVLFAPAVGGARRWIRLGPVGFQPSELAKLWLVVFMADYLDRKRSKIVSHPKALVVPFGVLALTLGLILLEPDLGNPVLLGAVSFAMLFLAGARLKHLLVPLGIGLAIGAYELLKFEYRRERLLAFLRPEHDLSGTGYQLQQSLLALGSGGWLGRGWGESKLKLLYLPTPHTDFIYPILGEELGLLGALGLALLFGVFGVMGFKIARRAAKPFGSMLAAGITMTIVGQAFFNIGVSLGLLPTKGISLPFFSFGGSSLVILLFSVGILINVQRESQEASR